MYKGGGLDDMKEHKKIYKGLLAVVLIVVAIVLGVSGFSFGKNGIQRKKAY